MPEPEQTNPALASTGNRPHGRSTKARVTSFGNPSPDISPFGPELQKYWDKRFDYFNRFDEGIQTDREGLFSVTPEQAALDLAQELEVASVIDGFAGIGGSAIGFARSGKSVIAIDVDRTRLRMARNNAKIYGVERRIKFIAGDFFTAAADLTAECVHLDPPWGGPSYSSKGLFQLSDFSPDGQELLDFCFGRFATVALRVPRNFAFVELDKYDYPRRIHDDRIGEKLISQTVIFDCRS
jgi:trimethylguanosine synthase